MPAVAPGRQGTGLQASPLHVAARRGPAELVVLLIDAAADPTTATSAGAWPCESLGSWARWESASAGQLLRGKLLEAAHCSGWLVKVGGKRRTWRRRFCVLTDEQLRYFPDEHLSRAYGHVDLRERFYEQLRSPSFYPTTPTPFSFELGCGERSYIFCAESEAELLKWMAKLSATLDQSRWHRLSMDPGPAAKAIGRAQAAGDGVDDDEEGDDRSPLESKSHEAGGSGASAATIAGQHDSDNLVTLEIGSSFEPVADLALSPMQSSLQQLHQTAPAGNRPSDEIAHAPSIPATAAFRSRE